MKQINDVLAENLNKSEKQVFYLLYAGQWSNYFKNWRLIFNKKNSLAIIGALKV